ncbi:hypothetical protein C2G38_1994333, partial [Gigaspora rosea]
KYLREALWAINITVNELGYSPFWLVYGCDAVTSIELTIESYQIIVAKRKWTTDELIEFRMMQMKNFEFHDRYADKHKKPIEVRDHVSLLEDDSVSLVFLDPQYELVYDSTLDNSPRKFDYRWNGPYVVKRIGNHGQCYLAEMDGSELREPFTRNRVKRLETRMRKEQEQIGRGSYFKNEDQEDLAPVTAIIGSWTRIGPRSMWYEERLEE